MSIIKQESLFDISELYEMEPTHRFDAILSAINLEPILAVVAKNRRIPSSRHSHVLLRFVPYIVDPISVILVLEHCISEDWWCA